MTYDPSDPPLMACGHAANALRQMDDGSFKPACVICMTTEQAPVRPSLNGRRAKCDYRTPGNSRDPRYGKDGDPHGPNGVQSEWDLPFFSHQPDKPFDGFYCGCHGWD